MKKRVVREFHWSYWRYGQQNVDVDPIFHEVSARAEVSCSGPFLDRNGHIEALAMMARALQPWFNENWVNRLLLAGDDPAFTAKCFRYAWPRTPFVMPAGNGATAMAQYLLGTVAAPLLEPEGLDVEHVTVRLPSEAPVVAYQAFLPGYRDPELRTQELEMNDTVAQWTVVH